MKLRLLCVGRIRSADLRPVCGEYLARLKRYGPCEMVEVKAARVVGNDREAVRRAVAKESAGLAAALGTATLREELFVLDERGRPYSSLELSALLTAWERHGAKRPTFIVGGAYGMDDALKRRGRLLSLSKMTLPHELCRLVLLEQLYRARTIQRGEPYHHA